MSVVGHSRPGRASSRSGHVSYAPKAEVNSEHWRRLSRHETIASPFLSDSLAGPSAGEASVVQADPPAGKYERRPSDSCAPPRRWLANRRGLAASRNPRAYYARHRWLKCAARRIEDQCFHGLF
jgi:hypothetical protein